MKAPDRPGSVLRFSACFTVVVSLMVPLAAYGYSTGPPNEKTGAPGEGTCHDCHNSFDLNSGAGALTITGPDEFEAGETYEILVSLEQIGQTRWGFEFTPLDIGSCTVTDPQNTQIDISGGNTYVKQTAQGTFAGDTPSAVWAFDWTAPADPPEEVTFYAAGNAANNNGSTTGDYVYTASVTSTLVVVGADESLPSPTERFLLTSRPNPAGESVVISYQIPLHAKASMKIFDTTGALVWQRHVNGGTHSLQWDTRDVMGLQVPSGLYFCRVAAGDRSATKSIVLLR